MAQDAPRRLQDAAEMPQDDPKQRQPNIELAKAKLGWEPKVNLENGLIKTIEYFKSLF